MNPIAATLGKTRHSSRAVILLTSVGAAVAGFTFAVPIVRASVPTPPAFAGAASVSLTPVPSLPPVATPTLPPLATPSLPPVPTPAVPLASPKLPLPSPSVPAILPSPTLPVSSPSPAPPGGASRPGGSAGGSSGGGSGPAGGQPARGLPIPFTSLVLRSPFDVALAVSIAVLPLLLAIWALVFGRTWAEARRTRDAGVRMALAADLGLSPRELSSLTTEGLFKLREQAAFDDLTGVLRRAAGIAATEREIARAKRQKAPLTVAFVDVDGLKQANDTRGHAAGDELLKGLASALQTGLRGQDLVVRYGGDEFVCILPDTPVAAGAEKMRQIQAEAKRAGIGFSLGVAELTRSDDVVSLLGRADRELYDAKARRGGIQNLHQEGRQDSTGRRRIPA